MHKIILSAIFVALAIAMGYSFLLVPNVEMISATVFIAGVVVGPRWGLLVGFAGELIFSLFNPLGTAAPPLLIAQVFCFMIIGWVGGLVGMPKQRQFRRLALIYGTAGLFLTLLYDVLTTLSFAIFIAGENLRKIVTIFTTGAIFYLTHVLVNTLIFAVVVPIILLGIRRYQTSQSHA